MKTKHKIAKSVRITDNLAVQFINNRALREHRSASNAATLIVLESLGKKTRDKQTVSVPANSDQAIHKDSDSSE